MFFKKQKIKSNIQLLFQHRKPILLGLFLIFTIVPIGYYFKTKNNQEQPLNFNISRAYFSDYEYQNKNQDFQISFLDKKDLSKPWVNFAVGKENVGMALELDNLNNNVETRFIASKMTDATKNQDAKKQDAMNRVSTASTNNKNQLTIPNILPDTDLTYQIIDNGLKEDIVLKNKDALGTDRKPQYQFTLKSDNVEPIEIAKGIYSPAFQNKTTKEYAFHFLRPVMIDANGAESDEILMQIKGDGRDEALPRLESTNTQDEAKMGNQDEALPRLYSDGGEVKYTIILKPSPEWLNSKDRKFPIRIDPSLVHDESSEFAGTKNRIEDIGSGATPKLQIQNSIGGNDQYTKLLLHADGANDSTSFTDSSMSYANRKTVTRYGDAKISTAQSEFGGSSAYFDGTGDYLSVPDSDDWNFGSGDFTIDFWAKPNVYHLNDGIANNFVYEQGTSNADQFAILFSNGKFRVSGYSGSSYCEVLGSSDVLSGGIWKHYAVVKTGGMAYLYVNGVFDTSGVCGIVPNFVTSAYVSTRWNQYAENHWNGYIDELRISKGIARWTSNFTPPTRAYDFKKDYAIYDSPVVDAGQTAQWNTISWTENGVATGDGETPYDSTNLVAGWNFNETSGTSAVSGGTCGTSCNGTLTNFASTASQDQAAGTGWTANNRRWGAGALSFDGSNDYVSVADSDNWDFGTGDFAIEFWLKTNQGGEYPTLFSRTNDEWGVFLRSGNIHFYTPTKGNVAFSSGIVNDESWHYVVITRSGTTLTMYIDGILDYLNATWSDDISSVAGLNFGYEGLNTKFVGSLDEVRIYKGRALSTNEILSNYNAGNIELQTRSGATTNPNDGTWEDWKPSSTGTETAVDAMDSNNTSGDAYTKLLLHGEGNNNATGFRDDSLFRKTVAANGDAKISTTQSKLGSSSMYFDGTGDYLTVPSSGDFDFSTNDFSIDMWVYSTNFNESKAILTKSTANTSGWVLFHVEKKLRFLAGNGSNWGTYVDSANTLTDNAWNHIGVAQISGVIYYYINGVQSGNYVPTYPFNGNATTLNIGNWQFGGFNFPGYIDELRISKGIARWTSNFTPPTAPYDNPNQLTTSNSTSIKTEGTSSMKVEQGKSQCDGNTVALWHLDETGGTGAYLKDSCGTNNGTPTGTSVVDGINNKARSFNGSSDYVTVPDSDNFNFGTGDFSIDFWFNPTVDTGMMDIINMAAASSYSPFRILRNTTTGYLSWYCANTTPTWGAYQDSTLVAPLNQWTHIALVRSSGIVILYANGVGATPTSANFALYHPSTDLYIGKLGLYVTPFYVKGYLDELRISKGVARTSDEIAEAYRLGRDQRISRTFSKTDFSAKSKLPFYVAADRRGTYLDATIGESAFANYEPDANTVGLWHLDEQSSSGAYLKDSSDYGNNGTPTGTTFIEGKVGKGRSFNNTNHNEGNIVTIPNNNSLVIGTSDFTMSMWTKWNGDNGVCTGGSGCGIINKYAATGSWIWTTGQPGLTNNNHIVFRGWEGTNNPVVYLDRNFNDGLWHYFTVTRVGAVMNLYVDGVFANTQNRGSVYNFNGTADIQIGRYYVGYTSADFNGQIDEVRIDKIARTAEEIRQAYEVGKRTHQITIDFSASLDAGNLITNSSDLSFIVNSQTYGAPNKGDNLYAGDKVIVKENYDGTEYLAQGTVTNVDQSTGAVTVSSWDANSTFPTSGFTQNAIAFKWQKEYWDLTGMLATDKDAINRVSTRITDGTEGRTIYLDDFKSSSNYLTNPATTNNITSANNRYFQYRAVTSTTDYMFTPYLSQVALAYTSMPFITTQTPSAITKTTASANGNITDTGGAGLTVSRRGFEYGLTQTNTWEVHEDGIFSTGSYTLPITTGLVHNTNYFIRAYAINSFGTSYGSWVEFNTNMDVSPVELKKNVELRRNIELK
ncbi:MAG: LamG domain-containing protein [Candidatus Moraniibacteriota bacterium]